jgi:very-short-patch-repair endonuclease
MQFANEHKAYIIKAYTKEGKSTYEIAEELGTYSNRIIRALKFLGVERRDYAAAQKTALKEGRAVHPTEGKAVSEETRMKLSRGQSKVWEEMSDRERERRSNISKAQWEAMPDSEKAQMRDLAAAAVRIASKEGSKTEKYVRKGLSDAGYDVQFHVKDLIQNRNMEIDLFVPGLKVAIEIDGPTHFLPIWGEEKLAKNQLADAQKSGLLIANGYVLIRVKQRAKSLSMKKQEDILAAIIEKLKSVEKKFPPKNGRLIEIEVE